MRNKLVIFGMLIPMLILIASPTATTIRIAHASSTFGNLGVGYDAGRAAAYNAFNTGSYDASCPVDFSSNIAYCSAYHVGYSDEWNTLRNAQP